MSSINVEMHCAKTALDPPPPKKRHKKFRRVEKQRHRQSTLFLCLSLSLFSPLSLDILGVVLHVPTCCAEMGWPWSGGRDEKQPAVDQPHEAFDRHSGECDGLES